MSKNEYKVYPWHGRNWHCFSYMDQWGNYHAEIKLPRESIVAEVTFGGGYGYDSWGSTYYLITTGELIHSSFYGPESYCSVYKDENIVIKSIVKNLWIRKNHPKVNIYDFERFKEKFPLIYKITKYLYCKRYLGWLSVIMYDKEHDSICD